MVDACFNYIKRHWSETSEGFKYNYFMRPSSLRDYEVSVSAIFDSWSQGHQGNLHDKMKLPRIQLHQFLCPSLSNVCSLFLTDFIFHLGQWFHRRLLFLTAAFKMVVHPLVNHWAFRRLKTHSSSATLSLPAWVQTLLDLKMLEWPWPVLSLLLLHAFSCPSLSHPTL